MKHATLEICNRVISRQRDYLFIHLAGLFLRPDRQAIRYESRSRLINNWLTEPLLFPIGTITKTCRRFSSKKEERERKTKWYEASHVQKNETLHASYVSASGFPIDVLFSRRGDPNYSEINRSDRTFIISKRNIAPQNPNRKFPDSWKYRSAQWGVPASLWINLHPSNRQISTFLIAIPLICPTRCASSASRGKARANILIIMATGHHCQWRGGVLSTCWLYHHFSRAADCRVNRTVKIGYDVCSARYRGCSRQPIRVILRESSYAESRHSGEARAAFALANGPFFSYQVMEIC